MSCCATLVTVKFPADVPFAGPTEGQVEAAGVEGPMIAYSVVFLAAPVRLTTTRKKYARLITFSTIISNSGSMSAVSTRLWPREFFADRAGQRNFISGSWLSASSGQWLVKIYVRTTCQRKTNNWQLPTGNCFSRNSCRRTGQANRAHPRFRGIGSCLYLSLGIGFGIVQQIFLQFWFRFGAFDHA